LKKVSINTGHTTVLTTDGSLYQCGLYISDEGQLRYPGWESQDQLNHFDFIQIFNNYSFQDFTSCGTSSCAVTETKLVFWGLRFTSYINNEEIKAFLIDLPSDCDWTGATIQMANTQDGYCEVLSGDGKVFIYDYGGENTFCGLGDYEDTADYKRTFVRIPYFKDFNICDYAIMGSKSAALLDTDGNIHVWGLSNRLGIGSNSTEIINNPFISLKFKNICEIVAGDGFFVAIDTEGRVYATGNNLNGQLGRWIGVGRGESNSRFKTALDWVECPELEI